MTSRDLVVAFNFPPFADASAVTMAKRIIEAGKRVDVVSQDLSGLRSTDPSLWSLVAPYVGERHVVTATARFLHWSSIRAFTNSGLRKITTRRPLSEYRSVYSRSMWPHSHVLAATLKLSSPDLSWRAEFSDPLLRHVDGSFRPSPLLEDDPLTRHLVGSLPLQYQEWVLGGGQLLHLVQALPFALASELVFTNEQQRTVMLMDLDDDALARDALAKSIISPHPVPPPEWVAPDGATPPAPSGGVAIGYFGTLYPNRGLGMLIEAVRLLPEESRRRLRVDIHADQQSNLRALIRRTGIDDVVTVKAALPYLDFLSRATSYDYLLAVDTQGGDFPVPNPFLPSKVSDYIAAGRPILAITSPGSELDKRDTEAKARVGDVAGLRDVLMTMVGATSATDRIEATVRAEATTPIGE